MDALMLMQASYDIAQRVSAKSRFASSASVTLPTLDPITELLQGFGSLSVVKRLKWPLQVRPVSPSNSQDIRNLARLTLTTGLCVHPTLWSNRVQE